jgi:hypothetical protein
MKKLFMASAALATFALSFIFFQMSSCKKSDAQTPPCDPVCVVKGTYAGTFTNQISLTGNFYYKLGDNNFTTGSENLGDDGTAFGGYWNSCDSIKINSFNSVNNSYYYFAGKFSDNKNTITGIYKNLTTTSETGTFTLTKQ